MNKSFLAFTLGLVAGAAAGVLLAGWLTDNNMDQMQEKLAGKTDNLREELADKIEALKRKLEEKTQG